RTPAAWRRNVSSSTEARSIPRLRRWSRASRKFDGDECDTDGGASYSATVPPPRKSTHQREHSRLPGELVVIGGHGGDDALVEELQIAWVNRLRLVGILANEVPAADVARPGRAAERHVGLARERIAFGRCERGPRAPEIGRGERSEIPSVRTH